jgi:hypothetical protein
MNESSARQVLMLQAFETARPASPNWSDEDRDWATRLALQDGAEGANAASADMASFISARARHAMQRLGPREPGAQTWLARRVWRARWVAWAALAGFVVGVLADSIGSGQRINLLAPPLWGVLAWNAVVYLLLLGHALARPLTRTARPGYLVRLTQRALRFGRSLPGPGSASASASAPAPAPAPASGSASASASAIGSARALQTFATLWLRCSAPLSAARATALLHAVAAALALGLIAGLYLRGLDYRAAWESTFLSAASAHAFLAAGLAPAVALSGIALPDSAAFEALRSVHGGAAPGASAAPWIHLMALTLLGFVVLPRGVLALVGAGHARWLASHVELPLGDAYFQRLANQLSGNAAHVVVLPYASTPTAQAALGLRALLAPALGDGLQLHIAPTTAFGAEDDAVAVIAAGTTLAIALFELSATPEPESQGRFVQQLAARAPAGAATVLVVDEAGFKQRFGHDAKRLAQRRGAWRSFAEAFDTVAVCVDLAAPDPAAGSNAVEAVQAVHSDQANPALQRAMRSPVARAAP